MPLMGGRESPNRTPGVRFAPTLVTEVSRPVTNDEKWVLYPFETHAFGCLYCRDPSRVQREGRQLCSKGMHLASDIANLLFKMKSKGIVYCNSSREPVRVEMPVDYPQTISLLRAIRRGGDGFLQRPTSYDRTYPVAPRVPRHVFPQEYHGFVSGYVSQPTEIKKPKKSSKHSPQQSKGSLYELDERTRKDHAKRESKHRYNHDDFVPLSPRKIKRNSWF